jgi:outer membrane protein TolC
VITEYYRLLQYDAQLKNTQFNYIRLLSIIDKIKPLVEAGRLPAYELEQARQDKIKAWDQYIQARQLYETQSDVLKLMLNIPLETAFRPDQNEWEALQEGLRQPPLGEEEAIEAALNQRLDLANAFDQTLDAQRHTEVAADALKADLSLVGLYSPANDNSRRYAFGADPGDLQRIRDRYEATLRLDLPLDREIEKNNYKRTLIYLAQQQRNHQKMTDQVTLEVRKAYRDARESGQRYTTLKEGCQLARQRLDNTLNLMQYARADSRDVLDAQKDYYQAQEAFVEAVFNYSVAILELYRDTGMLWIKPNGQWETKAAAKSQ